MKTGETKKIILEKGSKVRDLLEKIKIKPDTIIVMSDNTPIPVDDTLTENQEILIIQVASGG